MEIAAVKEDLSSVVNENVIEELKEKKFVLDGVKPIENGEFGYMGNTKSVVASIQRDCKVMIIPEELSENSEDFMDPDEIKTENLKFMKDSGIVPICYTKMFQKFLMIDMEHYAGGSLKQCVKGRNGETIDESVIKSLANQILSAMFDYSEKGIVHRDIKPENILIDEFGRIKISDFGLIRDANGQSKFSTKTTAGTKRYLSPELEDNVSQSIKSDVWAFGVVILELAFGRDAFETVKIRALNSEKIISKFVKRGGYSIDMAQFLSRCFERESVNRASVEDLLEHKWFNYVKFIPTPIIQVAESNSSPPNSAIKSSNTN